MSLVLWSLAQLALEVVVWWLYATGNSGCNPLPLLDPNNLSPNLINLHLQPCRGPSSFLTLANAFVLFSLCFLALRLQHQRKATNMKAHPSAIRRISHQASPLLTLITVGSVKPVILG